MLSVACFCLVWHTLSLSNLESYIPRVYYFLTNNVVESLHQFYFHKYQGFLMDSEKNFIIIIISCWVLWTKSFNFVAKLLYYNDDKKYAKYECVCILKVMSSMDMDLTCVVFIPPNWECLWSKFFRKIFSKCFLTWGICLIIAEAKIYVKLLQELFLLKKGRDECSMNESLNTLDPFGLLVEHLSTMAYILNK